MEQVAAAERELERIKRQKAIVARIDPADVRSTATKNER
jgi:hypothetical protein